MSSTMYPGEEQALSRGLSGIFRRKSKGGGAGSQSVFSAEQEAADALDEHFTLGTTTAAVTREGSKSSRWGILSRKGSMSGRAGDGALPSSGAGISSSGGGSGGGAGAQQHELEYFRGECLRQAQQLEELSERLQRSHAAERRAGEQLNMLKFKFELLIDLWAMRVLDNEELGAQEAEHAAAAAASAQL